MYTPPWLGAREGPRFGPKRFRAEVPCELSLRRLLGGVAAALEQVVSGAAAAQPWRVARGTSPVPGVAGGMRFAARGSYHWDNSPYVLHDGSGEVLTTHYDISGQGRSGNGLVQLEVSARPLDAEEERVGIDLLFREAACPMWVKHESEELVACTVRGLVAPLVQLLEAPVGWAFVEGDWLCNQLVDIPGEGVVRLTRLRG